jgi:hypothetical protein
VCDTREFWAGDPGDPFRKRNAVPKRYEGVVSPVRQYRKETAHKLRTHAERQQLYKSAVEKVRSVRVR